MSLICLKSEGIKNSNWPSSIDLVVSSDTVVQLVLFVAF